MKAKIMKPYFPSLLISLFICLSFNLSASEMIRACLGNVDSNISRTGHACLRNACSEGLKMGQKNQQIRENQIYTKKTFNQNNCYKKIYDSLSLCNRKMIFQSELYQNKIKQLAYQKCLYGLKIGSLE